MDDASEEELQAKIAATEDTDELSALLYDLASLRLTQGKPQEAQELFKRVHELRKEDISGQGPVLGHTRPQAVDADSPAGASGPCSAGVSGGADGEASSSSDGSRPADWDAGSGDDWEAGEWANGLSTLKTAQEYEEEAKAAAAAAAAGTKASKASGRGAANGRGLEVLMPPAGGARQLNHVVEMFDLNRTITSTHIESFLLDGGFHWQGVPPTVRWVDDEHALIAFPCRDAADVLLASSQKRFRVRAYNEASSAAHEVPAEELLPPRGVRPKTTTAVARRLIGAALGNREVRDKAEELKLAQMRREKKEQRALKEAAAAQVWDE